MFHVEFEIAGNKLVILLTVQSTVGHILLFYIKYGEQFIIFLMVSENIKLPMF